MFPASFRRLVLWTVLILKPAFGILAAEEGKKSIGGDREALLRDVREIGVSGVPGALSVFGESAFVIVSGRLGKTERAAVVAGARWEKGRVVAFSHEGYLNAKQEADTAKLILNSLKWLAGSGGSTAKVGVRDRPQLVEFLKAHQVPVEAMNGKDWAKKLGSVQVLCTDVHGIDLADVQRVGEFVRGGGGLLCAGVGWGWQQVHSQKSLANDFPGNALLAPAGIVWGSATVNPTGSKSFVVEAESPLLNANAALQALADAERGVARLSAEESLQATETVGLAIRSLPSGDNAFVREFARVVGQAQESDLPTIQRPLKAGQGFARMRITQLVNILKNTPFEKLRELPSAKSFPGSVPSEASRLRDVRVVIPTARPDWHSTGLYAPPGTLVTVELPAEAADKGLWVRVGCHEDKLWEKDTWNRLPDITSRAALRERITRIANNSGGPVYIEVPSKCGLGEVAVKISGAVAAPYFVLGKTSVDEWRRILRNALAPWAELECEGVILSVPSELIRMLEDPVELMDLWKKVVAAEDTLAGSASARRRPERIVFDTQISVGWMHSGYPIMAHLKDAPISVDVKKLKADGWGFFHELGHNHQSSDWTFEGTGEVTCNIFSLHVCETLCGIPEGRGHRAMEAEAVAKRLRQHLARRSSFEAWKSEPFLALTMYFQLRQAFGWEPFQRVFAEYRSLSSGEKPKGEEEKRDQWMVRFSRAVGRDLGPFFEAWGVPTSAGARQSVAGLPRWMPPDWPK